MIAIADDEHSGIVWSDERHAIEVIIGLRRCVNFNSLRVWSQEFIELSHHIELGVFVVLIVGRVDHNGCLSHHVRPIWLTIHV